MVYVLTLLTNLRYFRIKYLTCQLLYDEFGVNCVCNKTGCSIYNLIFQIYLFSLCKHQIYSKYHIIKICSN